jgi:hypothetical protein
MGELQFLLGSIGFDDLRPTYDSSQLITTAKKLAPEWVDELAAKQKSFRGWEFVSANFIIDRVYGLDYIIEVETSNQRIGFDFATNPSEFDAKVAKAHNYQALWKSLGVCKVIVLLEIHPSSEGQGLIFYDKEDGQDKMIAAIYTATDSSDEVFPVEFHLTIDR